MFNSEAEKSSAALHPSLDLFSTNSTVCGVENSRFVEVGLVSGPEVKPYEFRVLNSKAFLDLSKSHIVTRFKIVNEDGTDITTEDANEVYATANLFACTQFRQIQVFLQGSLCFDNDNFAYRSFISALLSYSDEYKRSYLRLAGYSPEASPTDVKDLEYVKRAKQCARSNLLEVVTPLWFEPATQSKAILPFIDFRLICFPSSNEFMIDRRKGDKRYKVQVTNMTLILHELHVHEATALAFNNLLQSRGSITYSSLGTQMRSFFIPPGIREYPSFKVFSNNIPRKVFFCLVDANSYNGNYSNPFVFKNFDLQNVRLEAGGEVIPFHDYQLDYSKGHYAKAYLALMEALSVAGTGCANGITPEQFASHCCIYAFDTSGAESDQMAIQRIGETTIKLNFNKDTPANGLYGIVLGEMVTNLTIDKDRVPRVY